MKGSGSNYINWQADVFLFLKNENEKKRKPVRSLFSIFGLIK
jgi:hypothetical protein